MHFKPVRILFFVDGVAPTREDVLAASALNGHIMFRNARQVPAEGALEDCDGVAGKVPPRYAAKFPTAEAAIEARRVELAKLSGLVGDSPAPLAPVDPPQPPTATGVAGTGENAAPATADGAGEAADPAAEVAPGVTAAPTAAVGWKAN